jgi:hypothetical protein
LLHDARISLSGLQPERCANFDFPFILRVRKKQGNPSTKISGMWVVAFAAGSSAQFASPLRNRSHHVAIPGAHAPPFCPLAATTV